MKVKLMAGQTLAEEEEEWRICTGGEQQEGAMACGLALGRPEQHSGGLTNRGLGRTRVPTRLFFHMAVLGVCFLGKYS